MAWLSIQERTKILQAVEHITAWQCRESTAGLMLRRLTGTLGTVKAMALRALLSRRMSLNEVEGLVRRAMALPRKLWDVPGKEGDSRE